MIRSGHVFKRALRLQPHHHSGRRLPRTHTSYPALLLMIIVGGVLLAAVSQTSEAAAGSGSPAQATPAAPVITSPAQGSVLAESPFLVRGVCQAATVVKIESGGIMRGASLCDSGGNFEVKLALPGGQNILKAISIGSDGGQSAASNSVTVQSLTGVIPVLTSHVLSLRPEAGKVVSWPLDVQNGQAPFAVLINWGDGSTQLMSLPHAGDLRPSHTYKTAGSLTASATITDAVGSTGYFQLPSTVTSYAAAAAAKTGPIPNLAIAWPLLAAAALLTVSFWLGEKFEAQRVGAGAA